MRALLLSACLLATPLATPLVAQENLHHKASAGLAGRYTVQGINPDRSAYDGTLEMTQDGGLYRIVWTISGQTYTGQGRLEGRVLTINWQGDDTPVVYVVMPDGTLHGTWSDGHALERLDPLR
ncbi:hypothetical protein [Antarctobacter sp.]|uniref:LIC10280 family protein n=1 Tax=Antarctobacter sp. TaxID=1872577 RepID=UPI002B26DC60|nr:hypothetical protein [Antarctobacter sp.]